ncbi:MAG: hypothetical protein M9928_18540 [Anaerolineae bacterium]|nr:hypothetical protein [Anaerolineae bacterium]MCO5191956.1 hypothetical protein [Anaerolineae bacterium]MCO5207013.1 hypothetical protein [Anaerolineae bacterium]
MAKHPPLTPGHTYHIYNRGNNGETIFRGERNYRFFLERFVHYAEPVAATYAYCLLPNHFHFLVYILTEDEQRAKKPGVSETPGFWKPLLASQQFGRLFTSYAKAFNKATERTGSVFENLFRRKLADSDRYFLTLITYIHQNPQRHGLIDDFREWPWSSYRALLVDRPTRIQRDDMLQWFGDRTAFVEAHRLEADERLIAPLIADDWL